jgi:hypothetical protein
VVVAEVRGGDAIAVEKHQEVLSQQGMEMAVAEGYGGGDQRAS